LAPTIDFPQSICQFGIARCDVTPPVGIYHRLWGAASHETAAGVHRPLTATAMVFRPDNAADGQEQVLVAVDHCLFWSREMNGLLQALASRTGLGVEQIAVTFSHTHSAGLIGLERSELPGGELIAPYLETLAELLGDIIEQARETVETAVICYGSGHCPLAALRDFWDEATNQFVCGTNPAGPADDTVLAARVTSADGALLATIVNYACHPTTLAWQNSLLSPDFPGAMREVIEEISQVPCVFIQGASGDLGPRDGFVGDVGLADRNGRQLGYAALAVLESLPPPLTRFTYTGPVVSGATLGTWAHMPLAEKDLDRLKTWQVRRWNVDLEYRPDLPTAEQTRAEQQTWREREDQARAAGKEQEAADCRAMVERMTRRLTRLQDLPAGPTFPFPVTLWRMGDAFWLAVEAELYNHFQRALRERFAGAPIVLATLTNGSRPSYLPTTDVYGKGIYQESIAVLAPGCLEKLLQEIGEQLQGWMR
jgi:hypothetical protein